MKSTLSRSQLGSLAVAAALALTQFAAPAAAGPPAPAPAPEDTELHKIQGIFDTELPKTEKKGSLKFILHPHLGDFTSRTYIRVPLGFRWGVNDHVELTATVEPYFDHGLKRGPSGNGIGDLQFGAKYAFRDWLKPGFAVSTGFNLRLPVGHPPLDLTDGYNHYSPYLVIAQPVVSRPGLTLFFSPSLDFMDKSSVAGSFRKNDPHSSSFTLAGGLVYDRFPYHYTLETGYQTTALVGRDDKQFFFIRPGFAWDLPRKLTFNSHGRWLVGLGTKITFGPDGTRLDSGGKLRGEFRLSRLFGRVAKDTDAKP